MYSDIIIKRIAAGQTLTMPEFEKAIKDIEKQAKEKGAEETRLFLSEVRRVSKVSKEKARDKYIQMILSDISDFCYDMRRLKNGQDISKNPASGTGTIPEE
jgi:hypothetical protein